MGHYILGVAVSGMGRSQKKQGPMGPASYLGWALTEKRPDLTDGGLRLPYEENDLYRI